MAVKTEAIPNTVMPMLRVFLFWNKMRIAPMTASGAMAASISKVINSVLKVVPILVPRIIPIDCGKVIIFAEISPIVMTITAVLLCRRAVMNVPVSIPFNGVLVSLISQDLSFSADILNNPIRMIFMPKINNKIQKINKTIYCMSQPLFHSMGERIGTCQINGLKSPLELFVSVNKNIFDVNRLQNQEIQLTLFQGYIIIARYMDSC
jgi:hypothetical protein